MTPAEMIALADALAEPSHLRECAQRLVDNARWGLAGALSPESKAKEIPSSAWSDVKSRHLASLRDALAAPQAEPIDPHMIAVDPKFSKWWSSDKADKHAENPFQPDSAAAWAYAGWLAAQRAEPKRKPLPFDGVVVTLMREGILKYRARQIVEWIRDNGITGDSDADR